MKILYLCNEISKGNGWGVNNYYTIQGAVNAGHDVTVLTQAKVDNLPMPNAKVHKVLFTVGNARFNVIESLKSFILIRNLLRNNDYDVVHILVEPYLIYFSILNHSNIVFSLVGTYAISIFRDSKFKVLYKQAVKKVKKFVAISQYTLDQFSLKVLNNFKGGYVPLGVDMTVFNLSYRNDIPKELAFTFVGHIKERKGLHLAIEAIGILKTKYSNIKLYVVGSDKGKNGYANQCKLQVEKLDLGENVIFLGFLPTQLDIAELFQKCIGNLLPSVNARDGSFEGFGLVHIEANACSILSIGSRNCGNESAIIHNKTGFLVEQNNVTDLVDKMQNIIDIYQTGNYESHAIEAYEHAKKSNWENYFKLIGVYYK